MHDAHSQTALQHRLLKAELGDSPKKLRIKEAQRRVGTKTIMLPHREGDRARGPVVRVVAIHVHPIGEDRAAEERKHIMIAESPARGRSGSSSGSGGACSRARLSQAGQRAVKDPD